MISAVYLTILLFCLGIFHSLASTPLEAKTTLITVIDSSWNGTDERNFYEIPTSVFTKQSQVSLPASVEPTPPTPPDPPDGYWTVTEGNITCIRAHLKIRFKIKSDNETRYLVLPPNANSSKSSCETSQKVQILSLHIDKEFDLAFIFEKNLEKSYILKNITLTIFSPGGANHFYYDINLFSVRNHYSFWCKSLITVSMKNVSMESLEMHIQAFGGTEKTFAMAEICEDDEKLSEIITIIVGSVITALVLTILITCILQQRKSLVGKENMKLFQSKKTSLVPKPEY